MHTDVTDALRDDRPFRDLRWLGIAWLVVYLPSYAVAYGWLNFLFLCNIGVIVTAIGLIFGSRLLLSSQAVAAPVIGLAWIVVFSLEDPHRGNRAERNGPVVPVRGQEGVRHPLRTREPRVSSSSHTGMTSASSTPGCRARRSRLFHQPGSRP